MPACSSFMMHGQIWLVCRPNKSTWTSTQRWWYQIHRLSYVPVPERAILLVLSGCTVTPRLLRMHLQVATIDSDTEDPDEARPRCLALICRCTTARTAIYSLGDDFNFALRWVAV